MLSSMPKPSKKIIIDGDNKSNITKSSWKVLIKWENQGNINTSSWNINVKGNNYWLINSSSGDIKAIHNHGSINTSSGDISLKENNVGIITTKSWNIDIKGINKGTMNSSSGDISIIMNEWDVITKSGDVELKINNYKSITTSSGDVEAESNKWDIITKSWDVELDWNSGNITTSSGSICLKDYNSGVITTSSWSVNIGDMHIRIEKMTVGNVSTNTTISVGSVLGWIRFGGWNIVSGNNVSVSIINGETYINGVKQWTEDDDEWGNGKHLVYIDDMTVDFEEKIVTKDGKEISDSYRKEINLKVNKKNISLKYKWQVILIKKDRVIIDGRDMDNEESKDDGGIDEENLRKYIK